MINVDRVYQKVLAFANKEQRGYITPQEFNLFADQAQTEIFEQYFYDIDQYRRRPNNNHVYGDILSNLEEKVSYFKKHDVRIDGTDDTLTIDGDVYFDNDEVYRLGMVMVVNEAGKHSYVAEEVKMEDEFRLYQTSPLHGGPGSISTYAKERPVYWKRKSTASDKGGEGISIRVYPPPKFLTADEYNEETDGYVSISYIKIPTKPNWNYVVVNDKSLYNATTSTNFELHPSEESELVYRILAFSGIAIEKPQLTQVAVGLETAKVQQEKQ